MFDIILKYAYIISRLRSNKQFSPHINRNLFFIIRLDFENIYYIDLS